MVFIRTSLLPVIIATFAVVAWDPTRASAQTYQWNATGTTSPWAAASSWLPNSGIPTAGSTANFGYRPTGSSLSLNVDLTTTGTAGIVNFTDVNAAYNFTGGTLALNNGGANTQINLIGVFSGAVTFANSAILSSATDLTITNNARWGGDGASSLALDSAVNLAGVGLTITSERYSRTIINGAVSAGSLTVGGNGYVILNNASNQFGTAINLNGGLLQITTSANLGPATTTLNFNGGTLRYGNISSSFGHTIHVATGQVGTVEVVLGNTWTSTAAAPLTGGGTLRKHDTGTFALTTPASFTGSVIVGGLGFSEVSLNTLTAGSHNVVTQNHSGFANTFQLRDNGTLASAAGGITVNNYGRLMITQANAGNTGETVTIAGRIGSVPISLNGGEFQYTPGTGVTVNDTVGRLSLTGVGVIRTAATAGHAGGSQITFNDAGTPANSLSRIDHAVLYFGADSAGNGQLGGTPSASTLNIKANGGLSDPGGTGISRGIIPWAAQTDAAAVNFGFQSGNSARRFVTYDADGFRPLSASEAVVVSAGNPLIVGANVELTGNPLALTGPVSVNSLRVTSGSPTISGSGQTLTIASGGVIGPLEFGNTLTFNNTVVEFAGQTVHLHFGSFDMALTGGSTFQNADGVVVSGINNNAPRLLLTGSGANAFTGGLHVYGTLTTPNQAIFSAGVTFNNDNQLGATDGPVLLNGGVLRATPASTVTLSNRTITLTGPGGLSASNGRTLTVPGLITGPGPLVVNSAITSGALSTDLGTVSVTHTAANTFSGGVYLHGGTLAISRGDSLGTGLVVFAGSVSSDGLGTTTSLRADAPMTMSNRIMIGSLGAVINSNGNNVTLSGEILGGPNITAPRLFKNGAGALTLSGTSPFTNPVTVNAGSLLVNGSIGHGLQPVSVLAAGTLGGNGTINRPVIVSGTLSPGSSPDILTLNSPGNAVSFNTGSTFVVEITGPAEGPGGYDQLRITNGNVALGAGLATLSLPSPTGTFTSVDRLYLVLNDGAGTTTGTFAGLAEGATVTALNGVGGFPSWTIHYGSNFSSGSLTGGNDVALVPVPEPVATLGLCSLMVSLFAIRRRSRIGTRTNCRT